MDELRLAIAPLVTESGRRLFDGVPGLRLETLSASATPSGYVLAHYRVAA